MSNGTFPAWTYQLLALLGFPATYQNLQFLTQWGNLEGANNYNNPLNITRSYASPATGSFGVGVQQYSSLGIGLMNTIAWMQHGYQDILGALQSGNPYNYDLKQSLCAWSGGGSYTGTGPTGCATGHGYYQIPGGQGYGTGSLQAPSPITGAGGVAASLNPLGGAASYVKQLAFNTLMGPFILLGAVLLIVGGGLWIVLGSKTGQNVVSDVATGTERTGVGTAIKVTKHIVKQRQAKKEKAA